MEITRQSKHCGRTFTYEESQRILSQIYAVHSKKANNFSDDGDMKRLQFLRLAIILLIWSISTYWFSLKIDSLESPDNSFHYFPEIDQFHPWLVWQSTMKLNCFWTSKWVPIPFLTWKKILICSTNKHYTCPFPQYKNSLKNALN